MNGIFIREATEEDLPEVLALYCESGIEDGMSFTVEEARVHFAYLKRYPSFRVFVALAGQTVAGTYELLIMDNMAKRGKRSGIVEDVAVHPHYRGQGIGRSMMEHALEQCRLAACYKLTLSSNLKREDAHRFYDALGFTRHGYSFQVQLG